MVLGAKPGKVNDRLSDGEGGKRKRAKEKRERNYFREWTRTRGKGEKKAAAAEGGRRKTFSPLCPSSSFPYPTGVFFLLLLHGLQLAISSAWEWGGGPPSSSAPRLLCL